MPLIKGKSPAAFSKNISTEMHAGKPLKQSLAIAYATKRRAGKAYGGMLHKHYDEGGEVEDGYSNIPLKEHNEEEVGAENPYAKGMSEEDYAHGGFIEEDAEGEESSEHELDMIGRIMGHHKMYSRGGMIANEDSGESASIPDHMAKDEPNEFDDLALRDDLEFGYTAANSGDQIGGMNEDKRRQDMIRNVMRSRAKRDRNPRPA